MTNFKILISLAVLQLALLASSSFSKGKVECKDLTKNSISSLKDNEDLHVIFFASWCPGCRDHMTAKHKKNTILINIWDTPKRAVEAVKFVKIDTTKIPCFIDKKEALVKPLKIPELPFETTMKVKKFKKILIDNLK